jgi:hypothetical protein
MRMDFFQKKGGLMNPRYEHECSHCVFLGRYYDADLYACVRNNLIDTVISRYSSDGPDYSSGLEFAIRYGQDPSIERVDNFHIRALFEAFKLAIMKGYKPRKEYV